MSVHKYPCQALQSLLLKTIDSSEPTPYTYAELITVGKQAGFTTDAGRHQIHRLARDGYVFFTVEDGDVVTHRAAGGDE